MISIVFFNNKGGVGKTSLAYHLAWAYADRRLRVLVVDLDPQSNLTAVAVDEERLEQLWPEADLQRKTIYGAVFPLVDGIGDVSNVHVEPLSARLGLLAGDIRLSDWEAKLGWAWGACNDRDRSAFRVTTAFHRAITMAAADFAADIVLIDVGPSIGAITRAAVIAADWVVTPLGADLFSVQALRNVGRALASWRTEWEERRDKSPIPDLALPAGSMAPAGYVVMQPNVYAGAPTRAYERWLSVIPQEYGKNIVGSSSGEWELGIIKHYRSLMALAHTARKPIFHLRAADGALGAHAAAAQSAGDDFGALAQRIANRVGSRPAPASG